MNNDLYSYVSLINKLSIKELEDRFNSILFTDNENDLFNKGKEFLDSSTKMTISDNYIKVLDAIIIYGAIKNKKR